MAQAPRLPRNAGLAVGLIIVALIIGGGITILALYPTTDRTSFYIAVAAIVLSPLFLAAAFLVSRKQGAVGASKETSMNIIDHGFAGEN